jgi:hypothetical protein
MKALIEVKDRKEAETIRSGLEDPSVRAFVVITGALRMLPSDRSRRRVLQFVIDKLDEEAARPNQPKQTLADVNLENVDSHQRHS